MKHVHIEAENLDDAWHQTVAACFNHGYTYPVTHGSYEDADTRHEFDSYSLRVKDPGNYYALVPIMPESSGLVPPTSREYVENYLATYLLSDEKSEKEDYTYGQRIVPQVDPIVEKFGRFGEGTNQCTMAIAQPSDILLKDPPCLRVMDWRVREDALHLFIYMRSWDLYAGFPANLGGFELLKQYMVDRIQEFPDTKLPDLGNGEIFAFSKGLHIYGKYMAYVEQRFGRK
jgi:thymidylate synthase